MAVRPFASEEAAGWRLFYFWKMGSNVIVAVVDGQGGGIGGVIIRAVRGRFGQEVEIWGLGTNAVATAQMMKSGANKGATGDNAIRLGVERADVILGTISIVLANSFMGEMRPETAAALAQSRARKLLIPLTQENVDVVGALEEPLPHLVERMMSMLREGMKNV